MLVLFSESDFQLDQFRQCTEPGTDQQKFVYVELSKLTSSRLGSLSLIRGMVSCGREDILLSKAKYQNNETSLFHELFQYIFILCQGDITLHYQAFNICLLWYTRLTKIASTCESLIVNSKFTSTLESTLDLVILNWDSPVEDVPEAVVDTFTFMMSVWERIKGTLVDIIRPFSISQVMPELYYILGNSRTYKSSEPIIVRISIAN